MVRVIFLVIVFMLLKGCCYSGAISQYGLPRKYISRYTKKVMINIDTTTIYREHAYFRFSKSNNIKDYRLVKENNYGYISFLKYYSNGKVGLFVIPKTEILNRNHFNPKRAKMGYYYQKNINDIVQKISTIGDCSLYISEKEGHVRGDSIVLYDKRGHSHVYKKHSVPKDFLLDWEPDW